MHRPEGSLRWDDLRVLLAVLRETSFSGAAQALGIEQSTVSRRIAQLEAELGGALFERSAGGPRPTDLAVRLGGHAERMEAEAQAVRDVASGARTEIAGRVRLALTESFAVHVFVPRMLPVLRERYPALSVDLVTGTEAANLGRREADLAIRFFRPEGGDLVAKRVGRVPTAVLAHRRYAEAHAGEPAARLDWIVLEVGDTPMFDARFVTEHVGVPPFLVTTSHIVQVEAVRAGQGAALLARSHLALDPDLVPLELGLPPGPHVEIWLVAPRTARAIPRVQAVWAFCEEALAAVVAVDGAA